MPSFALELNAPSKINLRLKVEGRREDGFHLLSMLNVTTSVSDRVRCEFGSKPFGGYTEDQVVNALLGHEPLPAQPFEVPLASVFMEELPEELAELPMGFLTHVKAVHLLADRLQVPLHCSISIDKKIPLGGGLGGASSDAAAVLVAAGRYLEMQIERLAAGLDGGAADELVAREARDRLWQAVAEVALAVGGDVPFFGRGGMAFVGGIGELVSRVRLADAAGDPLTVEGGRAPQGILLTPRFGCSTPEVYSKFRELVPQIAGGPDLELRRRLGGEMVFVNPFVAGATVSEGGGEQQSGGDVQVPVLKYDQVLGLVENDLEEAACAVQPELARILNWARSFTGFKAGLSGSGSSVFLLPLEMITEQSQIDRLVELFRGELAEMQQGASGAMGEPELQLDPEGVLAMTLMA